MSNSKLFHYIDTLKITSDWKKTFKKIHTLYYNNYCNGKKINTHLWGVSNEYRKLSFKNKTKFFVNFNLWALIMGPFYYLEKKMFKKSIILFMIFIPLFLISNYTKILLIPLFLYCCYYANRDLFAHTILNDINVKNDPLYLNTPPDKFFINQILSEQANYKPFIIIAVIFCSLLGYKGYKIVMDGYVLQDTLNTVPVVCSDSNSCMNYILNEVKTISSTSDKKIIANKYYLISIAYMQNHDRYNAINTLNIALNIDPKNMKALCLRGELCYQEGQYAQSAIDFKNALKVTPTAYFINFYIGRSFYKLHLYQYASQYFKVAAEKYNKPEYYEYWGYSEINNNNAENGVKILKKAISLYKKDKRGDRKEKIQMLQNYISKF